MASSYPAATSPGAIAQGVSRSSLLPPGLPTKSDRAIPDLPLSSASKTIAHPLLRRREPSSADQDDDLILEDSVGSVDHTHDSQAFREVLEGDILQEVVDADVTDQLVSASGRQNDDYHRSSSQGPHSDWRKPHDFHAQDSSASAIELKPLLPGSTGFSKSTVQATSPYARQDPSDTSSTSRLYSSGPGSTATLVPRSNDLRPHTPIPLSQILGRNSAPISLPKLDEYISSLKMPSLPEIHRFDTSQAKGKGKVSDVAMFPPMERLSGTSLANLEINAQIPPAWRNRQTIFSTLSSIALGITGSSAIASFYSVQGLVDTLQIFALILSTFFSHGAKPEEHWRTLFLQTIPNVLALNFASSLVKSLILLVVLMVVAGILLFFFSRMTRACCSVAVPEGLQATEYLKNSWAVVIVTFILTVLYLPLSTMAVHVLVWSDDLWAVPNPYTNATTSPPIIVPLGPADEYRDPLDFCYTTTMLRNEINYAPVIVILATLTVWFPIHLHTTISRVTPKVDRFTELVYLFAKLTALLLTAVIDPDNCLFRTATREKVAVARQIMLLVAMLVFFVLQCVYAPFLDPVNNASEWTSRLNYVLTSAVSLAVALNIPGQPILNGPVLYVIYIATYGLSFYFIFINMAIARRFVKKLARRIDFSIDIFSPRLDLSSTSPHVKRRIWQEAVSTLLLTDDNCGIPETQKMRFKQARDGEYPPYLLDFAGSPGERHVENLKILREVGAGAYTKAVALVSGADYEWFRYLEETIQKNFVGPDCYWKPHGTVPRNCTKFFGNAWWIPFPPTLVIRYDDGPEVVLNEVRDLKFYLHQNSSEDILRKRQVRMALRAMDGQIVRWPYDHIEPIGDREKLCCCGKRYAAQTSVHYQSCVFQLKRHGHVPWEGLDLGSGFDVELTYAKGVQVGGDIIGLTDDYDLTPPLAHFLAMNERLIPGRLAYIETALHNYRRHYREEAEWKRDTLSYRFLTAVYDQPREPRGLSESAMEMERNARVRKLMASNVNVFEITYDRLCAVTKTELATWWYIFWDDLWRRNWDAISGLSKYATDFNPHYPTSIAYMPLPRSALESFLAQRGLFHKNPKHGDFFHAGFLNKMYLRMNDIVFHGSGEAIIFHLGDDASELDMEEVDVQTLQRPSTLGTGGGTDHDDSSIRARPAYRWEGILEDPLTTGKHRSHRQRFLSRLAVWFGLRPVWRTGEPSQGLALDVKLENGKYVLLEDAPSA
ncbi:hypothetical protein BN946_scf184911.g96 [Trametes cinnabarina]|uniref:Uncharacterized protein n=1 Tax=Pycnoporus cinnabarinus TaxID=5643 RepID=A0A060SBL0_PYCCI|nr:hypothetical protein BN946_scf184911.g96 [Trametes cinnabarina]